MTPTLAELALLAAESRTDPHVCRLAPRCKACKGCIEHHAGLCVSKAARPDREQQRLRELFVLCLRCRKRDRSCMVCAYCELCCEHRRLRGRP